MRFTLKDYQVEAVSDTLTNLERARDSYHRYSARSQFSLAATTGAGKTVMLAAVIETLFFGSDDFDFEPDPGATVLWFSDDPSLNEQSRARINSASSELDSRLRVIGNDFSEEIFAPGMVYFLNAQKLRDGGKLVRGGANATGDLELQDALLDAPRPDTAQRSIYDVLKTTIEAEGRTLYFVLDEAHRGMKTSGDRETIVRRLINGTLACPPMPVVLGISATVKRFNDAMQGAIGRDSLSSVEVDAALVQASGLLKDDIVLTIPQEDGNFDTTLLRRAVQKTKETSNAWATYAADQGAAEAVVPLLVVQVNDKPDENMLSPILDTILEEWPELGAESFAHVFGTHTDINVGGQAIEYIAPQRVQETTRIRVMLAMEAISTGWDCPRAEVLISMRTRNDETYVHQLIGRMMRTPLARRIPGNEILNTVYCMLPRFDRATTTAIARMLMSGKTALESNDEKGNHNGEETGRRVLFDPVELTRNPAVSTDVWDAFENIPTVTIPRTTARPMRRLDELAATLSSDGLVKNAVAKAHTTLCLALDGRAVQYRDQMKVAVSDVLTLSGEETRGVVGSSEVNYVSFETPADSRAIRDAYEISARRMGKSLASAYVDHLAKEHSGHEDYELLDAEITTAAVGRVPAIMDAIEDEAENLTRTWLDQTRVGRKDLSDDRQAAYDRIESMASTPERISITVPKLAQTDRRVRDTEGNVSDLPTYSGHIMCAKNGEYPADLNGWERRVLVTEMGRRGFLAWYRNPARAARESLAVAYRDTNDDWKAMRPDFVFFASRADGSIAVDLVDPHGYHLSDAIPKLRGLAAFAETYGTDFRRIESVADVNGTLRVLDMTRESVRAAISKARDAKSLYSGKLASNYVEG